jgi:hypothetical protein
MKYFSQDIAKIILIYYPYLKDIAGFKRLFVLQTRHELSNVVWIVIFGCKKKFFGKDFLAFFGYGEN